MFAGCAQVARTEAEAHVVPPPKDCHSKSYLRAELEPFAGAPGGVATFEYLR